jgi:hypothetical protein
MRLEAWRSWWSERGTVERIAVGLWALATIVCCGRALFWPHVHSVYHIFSDAGRVWRSGLDLYHTGASEPFRYSPIVAAVFAPFSMLPDHVGGILWRLLGLGVFLGALAWWARRVSDGRLPVRRWAWLLILILPLSVGTINNGQSNLLLIGLVLAACAAATAKRWNISSACITTAFLFKVYPLAIGLLLLIAYPRRYWWRLPMAIAAGLALPFLLQQPAYVVGEYAGWLRHLQDNDRQLLDTAQWYRDFRQLWSLWVAPMDYRVYQLIEILAGAVMAVSCLRLMRNRVVDDRFHVYLFSLGCCWMTVFGPATESATYVFLAPAAAWAVLRVCRDRASPIARLLILTGYALLVLAQTVDWFPFGRQVHSLGIQPFAGLLLLLGFVAIEWADENSQTPICDAGRSSDAKFRIALAAMPCGGQNKDGVYLGLASIPGVL